MFHALADDNDAFTLFSSIVTSSLSATPMIKLLKKLTEHDDSDRYWRKNRKLYWPKFNSKRDSLAAFNKAMEREAVDSMAEASEVTAAYLGSLSGRARDIAALSPVSASLPHFITHISSFRWR